MRIVIVRGIAEKLSIIIAGVIDRLKDVTLKKLWRVLKVVLVTLLIAWAASMAVLHWSGPAYVQRRISQVAASSGLQGLSFHVRAVDTGAIELTDFEFAAPGGPTVGRVRVTYSAGGLRAGEVKDIIIDGLTLPVTITDKGIDLGPLQALIKPSPGKPAPIAMASIALRSAMLVVTYGGRTFHMPANLMIRREGPRKLSVAGTIRAVDAAVVIDATYDLDADAYDATATIEDVDIHALASIAPGGSAVAAGGLASIVAKAKNDATELHVELRDAWYAGMPGLEKINGTVDVGFAKSDFTGANVKAELEAAAPLLLGAQLKLRADRPRGSDSATAMVMASGSGWTMQDVSISAAGLNSALSKGSEPAQLTVGPIAFAAGRQTFAVDGTTIEARWAAEQPGATLTTGKIAAKLGSTTFDAGSVILTGRRNTDGSLAGTLRLNDANAATGSHKLHVADVDVSVGRLGARMTAEAKAGKISAHYAGVAIESESAAFKVVRASDGALSAQAQLRSAAAKLGAQQIGADLVDMEAQYTDKDVTASMKTGPLAAKWGETVISAGSSATTAKRGDDGAWMVTAFATDAAAASGERQAAAKRMDLEGRYDAEGIHATMKAGGITGHAGGATLDAETATLTGRRDAAGLLTATVDVDNAGAALAAQKVRFESIHGEAKQTAEAITASIRAGNLTAEAEGLTGSSGAMSVSIERGANGAMFGAVAFEDAGLALASQKLDVRSLTATVPWSWGEVQNPAGGSFAIGTIDLDGSKLAENQKGTISVKDTRVSVHFEYPLEVGTATVAGVVDFGGGVLRPDLTITLKDVTIADKKHDAKIEGLNGTIAVTSFAPLSTPGNQKLQVQKLTSGKFTMTDATMVFRVESPQSLLIERIEGGWAGGRIYTHAVRVDPSFADVSLTLFFDGLQLSQFLELVAPEQAAGEAVLYGRLPLRIRWPRIDFGEGYLYAAPGTGYLQLKNREPVKQVLESDPSLTNMDHFALIRDRLLGAVEDFEFQKLRVDLKRDEGGLVARFSTSGKGRTGEQQEIGGFDVNVRGAEELLNVYLGLGKK